jgi:glutathione reductase (NADPH)
VFIVPSRRSLRLAFAQPAAMVEYDFDLITLGAGSGGTRASRISAQHYGAKVACVELPFGFVATDTVGGAGGT